MPHFDEEDAKLSGGKLILVGVPAFLSALLVSLILYQFSQLIAHRIQHGILPAGDSQVTAPRQGPFMTPFEALAGPVMNIVVAIGSFALFVRFPKNLFLSALAFISSSGRLREMLELWIQLFFRRAGPIEADEGSLVTALHLHNPTAAIVILTFVALALLFMSITVVHETRVVPRKWLVAACTVALLIPLQPLLSRIVIPAIISTH
jgi:hypothetical protein